MFDINSFENAIIKNTWTFAKSMPTKPHEYTVRERWDSDDDFVQMVVFIRNNGERRPFFHTSYIYFDFKGYTYWTMGNPINRAYPKDPKYTNIINRAKL